MNGVLSVIDSVKGIIFATVAIITVIVTTFKFWIWCNRPTKQDFDRYQQVMENIESPDIYYFRNWNELYHNFPEEQYDCINYSALALSNFSCPKFIDKKLLRKEKKLIEELVKVSTLMRERIHFNNPSKSIYTIFYQKGRFEGDNVYDAGNTEHKKKAYEIKAELDKAFDRLITAYENFINCANKRFAERIPE